MILKLILVVCAILFLITLAKIWERLDKYAFVYAFTISGIICALMASLMPLSPSDDSFNLLNSLKYLLNGAGYTDFGRPYFNFYASNKIALLVYYSFAKIFNSAETGIRVLHFFAAFFTHFFSSLAIGKMFGKHYAGRAILLLTVIFPFIILTGPYIYPLAIGTGAAAFYFSFSKKLSGRICFLILLGFLVTMRISAAIFIFVFLLIKIIVYLVKEEKIKLKIKAVLWLLSVVVFCMAFKASFSFLMFKAGLHPYPNLENSAMVWTVDLGTRLSGEDTGKCVYKAEIPLEGDEISKRVTELWNLYDKADPEDYGQIKGKNKDIFSLITKRAVDTFLKNPSNIAPFLYYKAKNLLAASEKLYFYTLNYNSKSFAKEVYFNLPGDAEIYFNMIALVFIAVFAYLFIMFFTAKFIEPSKKINMLAISAGFFFTALFFICFTEVAVRYLLDAYVPTSIIIAAGVIFISHRIKFNFTVPIIFFASVLSICFVFSSNNFKQFKDAKIISQISDSNRKIQILLEDKRETAQGKIVLPSGEEIEIFENTYFTLPINGMIDLYLRAEKFRVYGYSLDYK